MSESEPKSSGPGGWLKTFLSGLLSGRAGESDAEAPRENYFDIASRTLDVGERAILLNLVHFGDLRVEDVMVPRAQITGVELSTSLEDLTAIFADAAHSRLPIYRETLDEPLGMVHLKDALRLLLKGPDGETPPLEAIKRDVLYVPPSMRAIDLLAKMQKTRIHMALVIDEYGGTDGLVTIEDIVEQIVGDIEDEHDSEEPALVHQLPDGTYEADAQLLIEDFNQALGVLFKVPDSGEGADTLGGLIFSLAGRVPQKGEVITHPSGLTFEILEADPRHIQTVRIDTSSLERHVAQLVNEAEVHDPT